MRPSQVRPHRRIADPAVTVVQRADSTGDTKTLPYSTVLATAEAIVHEGIATAEDPASLCGSRRVFQAWSRRTRD